MVRTTWRCGTGARSSSRSHSAHRSCTQAWACLADLVVNSKEAGSADSHFRNVAVERARVYQAFNEARKRCEAAGG